MAEITFNKDAVSSNVRTLLSKGIGNRVDNSGRPSATGTPSFTGEDVRKHQALIAGRASPSGIASPDQSSGADIAADFKGLDDQTFNSIQDVNTRIAELQAQQFENDAQLIREMQKDPTVAGAQSILGSLQMERGLTTNPERFAEIDRNIAVAQRGMDQAEAAAAKRVTSELGARNDMLNADIARLQGRLQNLTALDEKNKAAKAGQDRASKLVVPQGMAEIIKDAVPELITDNDVNRWVQIAPKAEIAMYRKALQNGVNYMPLWDNTITLGDPAGYETFLVQQAPESERAGVIQQINITKARMAVAREQALSAFKLASEADTDEGKLIRQQMIQSDEFGAAQVEANFQQLMQEGNATDFDNQVLGGLIDFIDPKGYSQGNFERAQELQAKIPQDAISAEQGIVSALKNMDMTTDEKMTLAAQYMGQQAFRFNTIARFTGSNVPGSFVRNKQNAIILALQNQDMIDQQKKMIAGETNTPSRFMQPQIDQITREGQQLVRDAARGNLDEEADNVIAKLEQGGAGSLEDWEVVIARRATGQVVRTIAADQAFAPSRSGMVPQAPLGLEGNEEFDPQFRAPPGPTPPGIAPPRPGPSAGPLEAANAGGRALDRLGRRIRRFTDEQGLTDREVQNNQSVTPGIRG